MAKKQNKPGVMRSRDLFDKRRIQVFDYRTGDFMRYEGDKSDIEKPEKQAEPEKENINQTKLF